MTSDERFAPAAGAWLARLGRLPDAVRQALVARQLAEHLPSEPLRVLDAGCGQGTQAIALARAGHEVVGLDASEHLLAAAAEAAAGEPPEVQARVSWRHGDLFGLGPERYDVVCCHGVAMYVESLAELVMALVAAARPGGLVSLLTRNRAAIAMRAGMRGDWAGALAAFDARYYANRIGVPDARADEPGEVLATLRSAGAEPVAWYGVRLFTDHQEAGPLPEDFEALLAAEWEAGRRDPYRGLAALTHALGVVTDAGR